MGRGVGVEEEKGLSCSDCSCGSAKKTLADLTAYE